MQETSATECVAPERFNRDYDRYQKTDLSTVFPNIPSAPTGEVELRVMMYNNHYLYFILCNRFETQCC